MCEGVRVGFNGTKKKQTWMAGWRRVIGLSVQHYHYKEVGTVKLEYHTLFSFISNTFISSTRPEISCLLGISRNTDDKLCNQMLTLRMYTSEPGMVGTRGRWGTPIPWDLRNRRGYCLDISTCITSPWQKLNAPIPTWSFFPRSGSGAQPSIFLFLFLDWPTRHFIHTFHTFYITF